MQTIANSGGTWTIFRRLGLLAIIPLTVYVLVRSVVFSSLRFFWYDEVCTVVLSRLRWNVLLHTPDGIPPGFYLLESASRWLVPNDHIAFRIPSILGICLTVTCLFFWLLKRFDLLTAFAASLVPLFTVCFSVFAAEARPYSLLVGLLAAAMLCYDCAPSTRWMIVLGMILALAECVHYYAVIATIPLFLAEAYFMLRQRIVRWGVWCALSCVVVPLLLFWQHLTNFRVVFGRHFWAQPHFTTVFAVYGWFFGLRLDRSESSFSAIFPFALFALIAAVVMILMILALRTSAWSKCASDGVLVAAFLTSPVIFFSLSLITHGGLTERYLLPTVLGIAPVLAMGLTKLSRTTKAVVCGLMAFAFLVQETAFWLSYYESHLLGFRRPTTIEDMISATKRPDLQVVVSNAHDYLPLSFYATKDWNRRLMFLADAEASVRYGEPDTDDKELLMFRDFTSIRVFTLSEFKQNHPPVFLLYSNPFRTKWVKGPDWWVRYLEEAGYSFEELRSDGVHAVYLVSAPPPR